MRRPMLVPKGSASSTNIMPFPSSRIGIEMTIIARSGKVETAKELGVGHYRDRPGRSEINGVDEMRKERQAKLKRRENTSRARQRP